jgi:hypothetical protein
MWLLVVKCVNKLERTERRGQVVSTPTSYAGGKERLLVPVYTVICVVMSHIHTEFVCLNRRTFNRFQARLNTINGVRIELTARQAFNSVLVLLLRTVARRGFVRWQRGRFVWERRRGPSAAYGHRVEYHRDREPLPPQRRTGGACAE